jgi:hypothetical protein
MSGAPSSSAPYSPYAPGGGSGSSVYSSGSYATGPGGLGLGGRNPYSSASFAGGGGGFGGYGRGLSSSASVGSAAPSLLPGAGSSFGGGGGGGGGGGLAWAFRYLRRGLLLPQIDVESLAFQLVHASLAPAKVYKLTTLRKQTKNTWAREDASFAYAVFGLVAGAAAAWGVGYGVLSPLTLVGLAARAVFQTLVFTLLSATAYWLVADRALRVAIPLPHAVEQRVEWMFAWDVATTALVPLVLLLHVAQYAALPFLLGGGYAALWLSNALYAAAGVAYFYNAFVGYLGECVVSREGRGVCGGGGIMLRAPVGNAAFERE